MTASETSRPAEMAKAYESQQVEQRLYDWWERSGFFTANIDPNRKPFTMSMPPPNVTGELHMGHAMFVTIEDVIVRWHRMLGESALWLPGTDHAGIATQSQVEKLLRSEGTSRQEVGVRSFCGAPGSGRPSMAARLPASCAGLARRAIGRASASHSIPACRGRFAQPSSGCTTMA